MRFLSLSAFQALLLAAATSGAVIALFFLKLRHRSVVVGSSLLWQRILDHRNATSLWEKLRRWVSLLITLTIALLIALALGRPYVGGAVDAPAGPTIIVLDSSPSMATLTSSGQSRWEVATAQAMQLLNGSNPTAGLMIADTSGRVLTAVTEDRNEVSRAMERMRPFGARGRFPAVPVEGANSVFITDGVSGIEAPASVKVISVFEPADNVGITAFEIRVDPTSRSGYTAYLEVTNFSEGSSDAQVVMSGVGGRRLVQDLSLTPGERWSVSTDLADFEGGGIRVGLQSAGDALDLDDLAFSYLPTAGNNRVTLITDAVDGYLETLLALSPRVQLRVVRSANFEDDASGDMYVFERFAPQNPPSLPSLIFGWAPVDWLPGTTGAAEDLRITAWLKDHPVMRSVPVHDVRIDRAPILDVISTPAGRSIVAEANLTPLIVADAARPRRVLVAFNLTESDFPFHIGFPVFVENVVSWFSGEGLAERHTLGEIELPEGTTAVTQLDGTPVATEDRFGRHVMDITRPGLYTAIVDGRRVRIAANLTDPNLSNVNQSSVEPVSGIGLATALSGNELWYYMLIAALFLVAVEWWTYNRRITL